MYALHFIAHVFTRSKIKHENIQDLKNKTHDDSNKINKSQEQCVDLSSRRLMQTCFCHLSSAQYNMQHFFKDLWSTNIHSHIWY